MASQNSVTDSKPATNPDSSKMAGVPFWKHDRVFGLVLASAVLLSIGACTLTAMSGTTLAYTDAMSHLLITGRVLGSSTPGAAQLGGVWLPFPHLLTIPFTIPSSWYFSGIGACILPMASYVAATGWLYRTGLDLTGNRIAGLTTALVFATNPNVLYLQSTPMTEIPLFACITAAISSLIRWQRTADFRYLIRAALATFIATLVRYEGWVLLAVLTLVVGWESWRRNRSVGKHAAWIRCRADLVVFGFLGASGVIG